MFPPHHVLGVAPTASMAEIKNAYRRLAKRYHPDLNGQDPMAVKRFRDVNEAYRLLVDSTSDYKQPVPDDRPIWPREKRSPRDETPHTGKSSRNSATLDPVDEMVTDIMLDAGAVTGFFANFFSGSRRATRSS